LNDSHAALHFNREILQTALNHVRQGIAVFDPDLQLICSTGSSAKFLGCRHTWCRSGSLKGNPRIMAAINPPGLGDCESLIEMRLTAYTTEGGRISNGCRIVTW